jgi:integrase/recombinase XerD
MASEVVPRARAGRTRPPGPGAGATPNAFSVAPVVDRFTRLLQSQERSPCTVKQYGHIARMFLGYVQKPLENVAPQDLNEFREHLVLERHYSKNSLYTTVRGLTCLFRSFGLATAEQLEAPRRPARLPHYLTEEETHRLLEAVKESPRDSAILHVLAYCGLRVGELCRLTVEDVDLSSNILHVRSGKGDRDREVIIEEKTRTAIDRYTTERALAGQSGGRLFPVSPVTVERMVRSNAERARINRRVTPHMLRHTLATTLLARGCDIRYIQKLLGHASVATTQIYTHVDTAALRDAYRRAKPEY